jgi:hypothetical protein
MAAKTIDWDFELHYSRKVAPLMPEAPWVLRVTDLSDKPSPVFVIKQRRTVPLKPSRNGQSKKPKRKAQNQGSLFGDAPAEKVILQERGLIYGNSQRRCLPVLREIVSRVQDSHQVGLELQRLLPLDRIQFRGNLPLDDESGCKLTLIFKLQERVKELDRVELIARRVERFTREEAAYWFSRISNFGDDANRWAVSGMKIVLGGQAKDKGVDRMLEQLRSSK